MKNSFSIILWFLFYLASGTQIHAQVGQRQHSQSSSSHFLDSTIAILEPGMFPDSGAYYIYSNSSDQGSIVSPMGKLERLFLLGVEIDMAWYRKTGGCHKPKARYVTETIYPEFFIVHLIKPNGIVQNYWFREIKRPMKVACPYFVTLYLLK